jgi:hypothetical protein
LQCAAWQARPPRLGRDDTPFIVLTETKFRSIIIIIIIIFVSLIIFGEFASQTEGLLLSLPKLCTGLEEALLLRTGAAQGA